MLKMLVLPLSLLILSLQAHVLSSVVNAVKGL